MSGTMNLAITIFGFVLSALFLMVICCRLLFSRARPNGHPLDVFQSDMRNNLVERSIHGMEPSVVSCFPTIKFNQHIFTSSEDNLCTICLSDYKEREVLRILPSCGHAFHIVCIDLWLRQHQTCPVCRISLETFSEWRHMEGPLMSMVVKARFVPGALPDHLFEQPKNPLSKRTGISKSNSACPVVADHVEHSEAGESSSLASEEHQGLVRNELEVGDRQQLLEHRVIVDLDTSTHHGGSSVPLDIHGVNNPEDGTSREACVSHTHVASAEAQAGATATNQFSIDVS